MVEGEGVREGSLEVMTLSSGVGRNSQVKGSRQSTEAKEAQRPKKDQRVTWQNTQRGKVRAEKKMTGAVGWTLVGPLKGPMSHIKKLNLRSPGSH